MWFAHRLLGDITNTALLTKNSKLCLYPEGFRDITKHTCDFCGKKKKKNHENKCEPFCTINQVSLVTRSSVALYTPTQAYSWKNGLLEDDCTPASILEFKSTTYHLQLLTRTVKSTRLTQNPTRHRFLMINQFMVKMVQSGFSSKNWEAL